MAAITSEMALSWLMSRVISSLVDSVNMRVFLSVFIYNWIQYICYLKIAITKGAALLWRIFISMTEIHLAIKKAKKVYIHSYVHNEFSGANQCDAKSASFCKEICYLWSASDSENETVTRLFSFSAQKNPDNGRTHGLDFPCLAVVIKTLTFCTNWRKIDFRVRTDLSIDYFSR